jgi:hypothetical protein
MESKYKTGDQVFEKMFPNKKMIVMRYVDKLYYCLKDESPKRKEWLFFEKELMTMSSH